MWSRLQVTRISWSLVDQGIVSGGTFLVHVLLARSLPPDQYGAFALLFGGLLTLQIFNAALLFHPLSVRLVVARSEERNRLLCATLALTVLLTGGLGAFLAAALAAVGWSALILPSLAYFFFWQVQEALRRGLLSVFRHQTATAGDAVSYLGKVAVVVCCALADTLTLSIAIYGMAATSAFAAIMQLVQLRVRVLLPLRLRQTAGDYWAIGGLWSLGNGLLLHGPSQVLLWGLAAVAGASSVAAFQAAANIVNLSNPILIGIFNLIPQTASEASAQGNAHAWRAARAYIMLGLPPIFAYSTVILVAPELALWALYGSGSPYLDLSLAVRLLTVAALFASCADIVSVFLHGLSAVRLAFIITVIGTVTMAFVAAPMIGAFGLAGACLTHAIVGVVRFAASRIALTRVISRQVAT